MMTCVGGPLDDRDMPVWEPENVEEIYPDIYYEAPALFYQKVQDDNGVEICHWYAMFQHPDPDRPNRWWNFYAYRGVHAEDAELGEIINANPVIPLILPSEKQVD
jgi:hypothetical protein